MFFFNLFAPLEVGWQQAKMVPLSKLLAGQTLAQATRKGELCRLLVCTTTADLQKQLICVSFSASALVPGRPCSAIVKC